MKLSKQKLWLFGVIFLVVIILITIIFAPTNNQIKRGSTYGRNPDGYGAWYQYMIEHEFSIQPWQKPFSDLDKYQEINTPITFLQINSELVSRRFTSENEEWVKQGNNLVILGIREIATKAPFSSLVDSSFGQVKIETTRRHKDQIYRDKEVNKILVDDFGTIVWQVNVGKGKIIYSTTQYLAANAYQNVGDNFKFLANLVTQDDFPIFVDEYLHGYKDKDIIEQENRGTILSYFRQTPIFAVLVQIMIILVIAIIAGFKRFGQPVTLNKPIVENSQAYLDALAGVLQKAESSDFVVEIIGKKEQRKVQKALGLGDTLLDRKTLISAWKEQIGKSEQLLNQLLLQVYHKKHFSDSALLDWLLKWQEIHEIINTKQK